MKCIKCNLHKDNNNRKFLEEKLERSKKHLEGISDIKDPNSHQISYINFWKKQVKLLEKMVNCKHKFK